MSRKSPPAGKKIKEKTMKKTTALVLALLLLFAAPLALAEESFITIAEWLENKGGEGLIAVLVTEIINPVLASVQDETGSVNLFSVVIDGESTDFFTADVQAGDILILRNPQYNEYEGSVEMADSVLARHITALRGMLAPAAQ